MESVRRLDRAGQRRRLTSGSALAAASRQLPVIGVVLVEPYEPENGARDRQSAARAAVQRLIDSREAAIVDIDTRLERTARASGRRTRFSSHRADGRSRHNTAARACLALKAGVPALAIDPVAGGAKIRQQAEALGSPHFSVADELVDADLSAVLDTCLSEEARVLARACAARGLDRDRSDPEPLSRRRDRIGSL